MIDHVLLKVKDLAVSKRFFEQALAPIGYRVILAFETAVGFGEEMKPDFWIASRPGPNREVHVAFRAASREAVQAFHRAALDAGGRDNGPPGVRELYHPNYYGAFILDPDGNNIEAVCHGRE